MATKDISDLLVCKAYAESERQRGHKWKNDYEYPYDILMKITGECFKVCYRAMQRAEDRGFIECGVSLRTGWLTNKGKEMMKNG